jgi:Protein of unknown function (DUF3443)
VSARGGSRAGRPLLAALLGGALLLAGCGGSGSSSTSTSTSPASTTPVDNTAPLAVNLGPANNYNNGLFTSVTVCVPGTMNCQTIPNISVDTGSEGLRILSSQLTLSLSAVTGNSGNALQECVSFLDGSYVWGPVAAADIQLAGETASSVPIQIISANPSFPVPSQCSSGGASNDNTVATLGANGILGIGSFRQDCGSGCTGAAPLAFYYFCANSGCQVTSVSLTSQLQNPVWMFPQDNNGLMISLPAVPAQGEQSVSGSLVFGIETQSDNALGGATVFTADANANFQATYNGTSYSQSYIDSGSDAVYFLDSTTLGIPDCTDYSFYYCPSSTVSYTVTTTGLNGASAPVTITVANAEALFSFNGGLNAAFNDLAGASGTSPSSDYFDFGMPFFYGRKVFVGIEGQAGPGGVVGPYFAY